MKLEPGTVLGNYEVISHLGAGGMGLVYRAHDRRLQRDVALKVLPEELASSKEQLHRFTREARAASALNHPNILTIHDIGETETTPYLVMELIDGRTLQQLLTGEPFNEAEIRRIGGQLADGLAKAHEAGIVHRDLKPANIMLTNDGFVKILDFGLAKRLPTGKVAAPLGGAGSIVTEPGVVLGTVGYMSPEQASGTELDFRSDQFSLGVILYEMAAGQRAFVKNTPIETLAAIISAEPPPLEPLNPNLSPELVHLIKQLLAKSASQRYSSTRQVANALRTPSQELEVTHRMAPSGAVSPSGMPPAADDDTVPSTPPPPPPSKQAGGRRVVFAAVAVALLAISGLGLFRWNQARTTERQARENLPIIQDLLANDQFTAAWLLARETEQVLPEEPELQELKEDSYVLFTATTEPPGATVEIKDYDDVDGAWIPLGTTPLNEVPVPRGLLRWRIRQDGYADVLAANQALTFPPQTRLYARDDTPAGMTRVAPGSYAPGQGPPINFGPFWIDRYEVKNKDFQAFVQDGGYEKKEYWTEPFIRDGQTISWEEAMEEFLDRTGQPGPATWELGTYPDGKENYPVQGVSWYEAAAYAKFSGKSLPTVHHWRHAAGLTRTMFANGLLQSNIGRPDAGPMETSGAMDPFGTSDMAGNVKEWCSNSSGSARFSLGGAWSNPRYLFGEANIQNPFERSEEYGFRCVKYDSDPDPRLIAAVESLVYDFSQVEPVADDLFEAYRSFYAYDQTDLEVEQVSTETKERYWRKEVVTFNAAYNNERVPLHLFLPLNTEPPYQTVVYFPATFAMIIPTSEDLDRTFSDFIPRSGRALAYPIYQRTYERRSETPLAGLQDRRDLIIQWSKDVQRTIDYLETRDDIDTSKIAFMGLSLGAVYGPIFTAIEDRFQVALQVAGGLAPQLMSWPSEANPIHFVPRSTIPTLMLNGAYDYNYPIDTTVQPLYELFGAPPEDKKLVILDSAHIPPRNEAFREILAWLDQHFGPP